MLLCVAQGVAYGIGNDKGYRTSLVYLYEWRISVAVLLDIWLLWIVNRRMC